MLCIGNYVTKVRYIQSIILERITTIRKIHSNISSNNIVFNLIFLTRWATLAYLFEEDKITSERKREGYPRWLEGKGRNEWWFSFSFGVFTSHFTKDFGVREGTVRPLIRRGRGWEGEGKQKNRSVRDRGGCSRPRAPLQQMRLVSILPKGQWDLWLSPSVLGFLWALSIYQVLTMCQAEAGSFSYDLSSHNRPRKEDKRAVRLSWK